MTSLPRDALGRILGMVYQHDYYILHFRFVQGCIGLNHYLKQSLSYLLPAKCLHLLHFNTLLLNTRIYVRTYACMHTRDVEARDF